MIGLVDRLALPVLHRLPPETAHFAALRGLSLNLHPSAPEPAALLRTTVLGLDFPGPVGLAAGFDKDGRAVPGLARLGFGFVEVGTVTPRPQSGNPKPRLFRQDREHAVINRLGFPGEGFAAVHHRLARIGGRAGVVGVNLGANRDSADRGADYVAGIGAFADVASYFVLNVSSPNTPGLRTMQFGAELDDLLGRCLAAREEAAAASGRRVPLLLKIAPDIDDDGLAAIAGAIGRHGIDGAVVSNTTLSRDGVADRAFASEAGGLSGRPLFHRSTVMLARLRRLAGPGLPLIGVGGIDSADTAWQKFAAGADLVQLYTGFLFAGLGLPAAINGALARRLRNEGRASIREIVGTRTGEWAARAP